MTEIIINYGGHELCAKVDLDENKTPIFWHSILIFVDPNYMDLLPLFNEMSNAVMEDIEKRVLEEINEGRVES